MQDIIPHSKVARGSLRPPARPDFRPARRAVDGILYTRRTTTLTTPTGVTETIVDETITSVPTFEPAPMTRPIEHLSPEGKIEVLQRALARAQIELKAEKRSRKGLRHLTLTKGF